MKKQLYNKFDKHVVPTLPRVTFEGRIHVVLSRAQAEKAVNYLLAQPILGLDTETRPSVSKGPPTAWRCCRWPLTTPASSFA